MLWCIEDVQVRWDPGHNATRQNATRKLDRRKKCHKEKNKRRTKYHCLILRELNGDTVETRDVTECWYKCTEHICIIIVIII